MGKKLEGQWAPETLIGGHPALDFVNTAGGRTKSRDVERLLDYGTLLGWSEVSTMLHAQESRSLQEAHFDADEQRAELRQVRKFREALHTCLMAEQSGSDWPDGEAADVKQEVGSGIYGSALIKRGDRFVWHSDFQVFGVALPRARLALAVEALLRSEDLRRTRNCERCSWLFIDHGRGRRRRWCSMAACGSRAKSARYYRRQKNDR